MITDTPEMTNIAEITPEQIKRAKQIFAQNDPRQLPSGSITTAKIAQADLNIVVNYFANQYLDGSAELIINSGTAQLDSSIKLPNIFGNKYVNIHVEARQTAELPEIEHFKIGKLPIPEAITKVLLNQSLNRSQWQKFVDTIIKVEFAPQQLEATYRWLNMNGLHTQLSKILISPNDQRRMQVYQQELTKISLNLAKPTSLTKVFQELFALAELRSLHDDAIAENRALILILALYVNRLEVEKILPVAQAWPTPEWRILTLNARDDFCKHYLVSALLAAYAGTPLAEAMGTFKELEDAQGGSGFSFNDIAADQAGSRMGELAVKNMPQAKKIQQFFKRAHEADFMPGTVDLPEFMSEQQFIQRYGGIHGKGYQQMEADITQRIARLAINQVTN